MAKGDFKDKEKASLAGKKSSNKGKKHKSTLLKETLGEKIQQLDSKLFDVISQLLNSNDSKERSFIAKELLKYRLPQKREHLADVSHTFNIKFDM